MPAKIKQGKYVDSDGVQQNVVFIGAEKAIFDVDGARLDNKLADMSKASGLTAEDAEGLLGTPDANVNFQALVDAIANKVMNELVTNSALTAQLANYVTKAMMSDVQVNDNDHVPTSSLVYNMNEDITQLNSDLQFTTQELEVNSYGTGSITLQKIGRIVILIFSGVQITEKNGSYTYIATSPYKPAIRTAYQDACDANGTPFRIAVNVNGEIDFYYGNTSPFYYGYFVYISAE